MKSPAAKATHTCPLVYQINPGRKRLLVVIMNRDIQSLASFFGSFGPERCARIKVVCSDMWKHYINVIARMLPGNTRNSRTCSKRHSMGSGNITVHTGHIGSSKNGAPGPCAANSIP